MCYSLFTWLTWFLKWLKSRFWLIYVSQNNNKPRREVTAICLKGYRISTNECSFGSHYCLLSTAGIQWVVLRNNLWYILHPLVFRAGIDCSESFSTGAPLFVFSFMSKVTCRDDCQSLWTPRPTERNANRKGPRYTSQQLRACRFKIVAKYLPFIF